MILCSGHVASLNSWWSRFIQQSLLLKLKVLGNTKLFINMKIRFSNLAIEKVLLLLIQFQLNNLIIYLVIRGSHSLTLFVFRAFRHDFHHPYQLLILIQRYRSLHSLSIIFETHFIFIFSFRILILKANSIGNILRVYYSSRWKVCLNIICTILCIQYYILVSYVLRFIAGFFLLVIF